MEAVSKKSTFRTWGSNAHTVIVLKIPSMGIHGESFTFTFTVSFGARATSRKVAGSIPDEVIGFFN
jgi:hypothetical protein